MSPSPLTSRAVVLAGPLASWLKAVGLGSLVRAFGPLATLGLLVAASTTASALVFGTPGLAAVRARLPGGASTDGTVTADGDVPIEEAIERVRDGDDELTGDSVRAAMEAIATESAGEPGRTGAVADRAERSRADTVAVAPDRIVESESFLERRGTGGAERYVRIMIVSTYPSRVTDGWLDQLFTRGLTTAGADVRVSYHLRPRDAGTMKRKLDVRKTRITSQIREKREKGKLNTVEERQQLEQIERLREELAAGATKLFDFGLYLEVVAESEATLDDGAQELKQILARANATATTLYDRQLQAQRAMAPLANDPVRKTQLMDLAALGTTFPFTDPSVVEPAGVLMGFHTATDSPIVVDRFAQSGHNMLISGKIGSGKSYLAKLTMWRRLLIDPDTEVLIIDPVGGFDDIVEAVDGQRVTVDTDTVINPLEIEGSGSDARGSEGSAYDDKLRSVMGMFEAHFADGRTLSKEEEGVLRRAIRLAYLERGITKDPTTHDRPSPTIADVLAVLEGMAAGQPPADIVELPADLAGEFASLRSETEEATVAGGRNAAERNAEFAHSVLLGLEDFTAGGQRANLNGSTTVELQDRVVQFDLSNVADGSNEGLIMHIVLDWLFQRAKAADDQLIVVIDEAHYMLGHDQALDMLNLFARHSRHYGAGLTLISQTVDEFMTRERAKEIYDQCDVRALMRHQDIGREATEALDLSEREREFVLGAQAGNAAEYAESLLYVSDVGKMRMRVLANDFEHCVIDGDEDPWRYLVEHEVIDRTAVPADGRPTVDRPAAQRSDGPPGPRH